MSAEDRDRLTTGVATTAEDVRLRGDNRWALFDVAVNWQWLVAAAILGLLCVAAVVVPFWVGTLWN